MLEPGKFSSIPAEEYHSADAISHSRLEVFRDRPIKYYKRFVSKSIPARESHSFDLGRAAHDLILEGDKAYSDRVAIWRGGNKVKVKKEWDAFQAANAHKNIITAQDDINILAAATALFLHPQASQLLTHGKPEITWRMNSKNLPLTLQCRTDLFAEHGCKLSEGRPYAVDLKTTASLDDSEFINFQKSFERFGYHRQAGFYTALLLDLGVRLEDFFFVAVEIEEPFGVEVWRVKESALAVGLQETLDDLNGLALAYASNTWPNRASGIKDISCSDYYLKKHHQFLIP